MKRRIIVASIFLCLGIVVFTLIPISKNNKVKTEVVQKIETVAQSEQNIPPSEQWDAEQVNQFQREAMNELVNTLGEQEYASPIKQRPKFVSPAEWLILRSVAQQHNKPEQEFTRMVNFLWFSKLLEWFESSEELSTSIHHKLVEHLLLVIPNRVRSGDFDLAEAQRLQSTLVSALEKDTSARRQRLRQESARIGVIMDIQ